MPELPEVETTVNDLNQKVRNRTFVDVWTDFEKMIKKPPGFEKFKRDIQGKTILKVRRRAKNILFDLSQDMVLLVHQKLTGHFLYGRWKFEGGIWRSELKGNLAAPINRFIHLVFFLDNGDQIALSDLRKFAKAELWSAKELEGSKEMRELGCEPMEEEFTFEKFKECLLSRRGKIKQILMDQNAIAGIGNIYSDEILWKAKVHPCSRLDSLDDEQLKAIYKSAKSILASAIKLRGTTVLSNVEEYRGVSGGRGGYQARLKVYRRDGLSCPVCGGKVERLKMNGRSWHFCPKCQKLKGKGCAKSK
jgi:formamidopyrimidine-DNA glycosylase